MNGIYFLANDRVREWVITAVESIRARGCTLPIAIIPFDDQTCELAALSHRYGYQIWNDASLARLDAIGRAVYPGNRVNTHMFRRLASFWGPFDQFIFTDVDIVAMMNWNEILEKYSALPPRLWYFDRSPNEVYKPGPLWDELRGKNRGVCFNGGFFASSRGLLNVDRLEELVWQALGMRSQFATASGEQPYFNYYIDHDEIALEKASEQIPDLYDWCWAGSNYFDQSPVFTIANREGTFRGKRFPLIHWAGFDISPKMPYRELFLEYRLLHAPFRDTVRCTLEWQVHPRFKNAKNKIKTRLPALRRAR